MQPASISYGKETKPATEEQEEGTREAVIIEESGTQDEECVRMNPGQVDAVALDVQQETAAPGEHN